MDHYVIVFETTHHAIAASRFLKGENYKIDIIPTPRKITNNCGLAIKLAEEDLEEIKKAMKASDIKNEGIHKI